MTTLSARRRTALQRISAAVTVGAVSLSAMGPSSADEDVDSFPEPARRWSYTFSAGLIGDTSAPGDYFRLDFNTAKEMGEGHTYNFTAAYRLREFDWRIGKRHFRPYLELPMMLTLVDEKKFGLYPDYNAGIQFRWRDWPWNRTVTTTIAMGIGVSYTSHVWTADRERHPGEYRAHLKFWLPIELTLAHPKWPQHQLTLFIDHQSGGHITDEGGHDAWGLGYRYGFH